MELFKSHLANLSSGRPDCRWQQSLSALRLLLVFIPPSAASLIPHYALLQCSAQLLSATSQIRICHLSYSCLACCIAFLAFTDLGLVNLAMPSTALLSLSWVYVPVLLPFPYSPPFHPLSIPKFSFTVCCIALDVHIRGYESSCTPSAQ